MKASRIPLGVLTLITLSGACKSTTTPFGGECMAPRSIAIALTIVDSVTGAGIADSATGSVTASAYQDSLHHILGFDSLAWAGERLGTYSVTVHRPRYADWTRASVVVSTQGFCGNVIPVPLTARMVMSP